MGEPPGGDSLMPLAASLVVLVYAVGVVVRRSTAWYEWLMAAAGVGFGIWYWAFIIRRARRDK